jgi:hypothetical protein
VARDARADVTGLIDIARLVSKRAFAVQGTPLAGNEFAGLFFRHVLGAIVAAAVVVVIAHVIVVAAAVVAAAMIAANLIAAAVVAAAAVIAAAAAVVVVVVLGNVCQDIYVEEKQLAHAPYARTPCWKQFMQIRKM